MDKYEKNGHEKKKTHWELIIEKEWCGKREVNKVGISMILTSVLNGFTLHHIRTVARFSSFLQYHSYTPSFIQYRIYVRENIILLYLLPIVSPTFVCDSDMQMCNVLEVELDSYYSDIKFN